MVSALWLAGYIETEDDPQQRESIPDEKTTKCGNNGFGKERACALIEMSGNTGLENRS